VTGLVRPWPEVGWVVVDVEGNGQQPPDLVEAACLPIDSGQPGQVSSWLVRPPRPITAAVARIHRISNREVAAAPAVGEVAEQIRAALDGRVVVGHHVGVDVGVLRRELGGWQPTTALDTLWLAKAIWPALRSYRLDALAERAKLPAPPEVAGRRHRAGHDATLTAGLFVALARAADPAGTVSAARLLRQARPRPAGPDDPSLF
jgi:exodeoxyribonuclease X